MAINPVASAAEMLSEMLPHLLYIVRGNYTASEAAASSAGSEGAGVVFCFLAVACLISVTGAFLGSVALAPLP